MGSMVLGRVAAFFYVFLTQEARFFGQVTSRFFPHDSRNVNVPSSYLDSS